MTGLVGNVLECIGDTALLRLRHGAPESGARVLIKVESENPGSMKDRMARAMIEGTEADGRLKPGAPVVEYTGGSTGGSLSLECGVKAHPLHIVSSRCVRPREAAAHDRPRGDLERSCPAKEAGA